MDCVINKSIFLRANGNMACWCSSGALHFLQRYDEGVDYGEQVYMGPIYERLRDSLAAGQLPFPDSICPKCEHVFYEEPFDEHYRRDRVLECFHIEPSFACNLSCTGCRFEKRRSMLEPTAAGHMHLAPEALDKILGDLRRAGVGINFFMAEGHGDALCNKRVWELVQVAKRHYPETHFWLGTNAQHPYDPEKTTGTPLDEIRFAVDGATAESYRQYRSGGDLNKALRFMREFRAANPRVKTVWKYIVFDHNDSPEEIRRAQELAAEIGIDVLDFNLTTFGPVSHRYHRPEDLPVLVQGVDVRVSGSLWGMSVENLRSALQQIGLAIERGDAEAVRSHSDIVFTQLQKRFGQGADIDYGYYEVFYEFLRMARGHFPDLHDLKLLEGILVHNRILPVRKG